MSSYKRSSTNGRHPIGQTSGDGLIDLIRYAVVSTARETCNPYVQSDRRAYHPPMEHRLAYRAGTFASTGTARLGLSQ
jgi:hypothetical protein